MILTAKDSLINERVSMIKNQAKGNFVLTKFTDCRS